MVFPFRFALYSHNLFCVCVPRSVCVCAILICRPNSRYVFNSSMLYHSTLYIHLSLARLSFISNAFLCAHCSLQMFIAFLAPSYIFHLSMCHNVHVPYKASVLVGANLVPQFINFFETKVPSSSFNSRFLRFLF